MIEVESYFLEISRDIHLNSVRAKIVGRPEDWRWSSYAGYRHVRDACSWMTYDRVLGAFGREGSEAARRRYGRLVQAGIGNPTPSPFVRAVSVLVLGSGGFVSGIRAMLKDRPAHPALPQVRRVQGRPSLDAIVQTVSRHFGREQSPWQSGQRTDDLGRAVAAYLVRRLYGYPATAVASALGCRGHRSVDYALGRIENADRTLAERVAAIEEELAY